MKTMNFLAFAVALFISLVTLSSCEKITLTPDDSSCGGTSLLVYNSLSGLQSDYNQLKSDYEIASDEQVLDDFESNNNHYSLRTKQIQMDDNIIPDDQWFDAWKYTSDDILGTLLNEAGMVVIGNELYAWSDGCAGFKAPYSCDNYGAMNDMMRSFQRGDMTDAEYSSYLINNNISIVDLCSSEFDLESKFDGYLNEGSGARSDCELETSIGIEIISNDPVTQKAEIELHAYNLNTGVDVVNAWYLTNVQSNEVRIIGGPTPGPLNQLWNDAGGVFLGSFVRIEVDYTTLNVLDVYLESVNEDLSCFGREYLTIDLICPIMINAEPLNPNLGQWKFTIEGLPAASGNASYTWSFGDGSAQVFTNNTSVIHNYPIPCAGGETYTVTVEREGDVLCNFPLSKDIYLRNPCLFNKMRSRIPKFFDPAIRFDGKRVVILSKLRANGKLKNKIYHRVKGKTIEAISGNLTYKTGQNCQQVSYPSLMQNGNDGNPASHNKKRKLKQRYKDGTSYYLDVSAPYVVRFKANNGYSRDFQFNEPCLSKR